MKKYILTFFVGSIYSLAFAQVQPVPPAMPTPNAANLGLYGDVPVSHFTGTPNIDVPIHNIQTEFVSLPISISYHAGGFRPDVHPSWIGEGWTLNAGGVITRSVKDKPDEYNDAYPVFVSYNTGNLTEHGFYYTHSLLNSNTWYSPSTNQVQDGSFKDREPDIFTFNFLGFSGKFFLDHTGNWKVQSDKPLKVYFDPADFKRTFMHENNPGGVQRNTFNKFTLVDDKGVKYTFGTDNAIEYSVSMGEGYSRFSEQTLATSWYLVKITPPKGTEILLMYERGPYQSSFSYFQYQSSCFQDFTTASFLGRYSYVNSPSAGKGLFGNLTSPVYLTGIYYPKDNVSINFTTSKSNELSYPLSIYKELKRNADGSMPTTISFGFQLLNLTSNIPYFSRNHQEAQTTYEDYNISKFKWLKLDNIRISYSNSVLTHDQPSMNNFVRKQVTFNYTENSNQRLRLNSITTSLADNSDPQSYLFQYDQTPVSGYLAEISDHWGFSNGNPLSYTGANGYSAISDVYNYRQPVAGKALCGLLNQIIYPTGGHTKFYYENHNYSSYVGMQAYQTTPSPISESGLAGGARIKKIETYDGMGNKTSKEYFYVHNYNPGNHSGSGSSGILEAKPKYQYYFTGPVGSGTNTQYVYNSSAIVPATSTSGRSIGYTTVTEKFQDGTFKTYTFTNHDNGYADLAGVYEYTPSAMSYRRLSSTEFERGKLLTEKSFTSQNNLVAKKELTYQRVGFTAENFVRSVNLDRTFCFSAGTNSDLFPCLAAYYQYCHFFMNDNVKEYYYNDGKQIVNETINEFDTYGNLTKQVTYASNGAIRDTRYSYPYNYSGDAVIETMKSKNMLAYPITIDKYSNNQFLEGTKNIYSSFSSGSFIALSEVQSKRGNLGYETRVRYNRYDSYGNILELQKDKDVKESYLWAYNSRWPVAKVIGADSASISSLVNESILNWPDGNNQLQQQLSNLRNGLPNALVESSLYSYHGDLISQSDPAGKNVSYEYDSWGRLSRIRDHNNNVLKQVEYKIGTDYSYPFKNQEQVGMFTKEGCSEPGYAGSTHIYRVEANTYGSFVSVPDANSKAQMEVNARGQQEANENGFCYPYWLYSQCCGWSSMYSNFALTGTGSVNFSLVVVKSSSGGSNYFTQIGTLTGLLFLPSSNRNINFTSNGVSGMLTITSSGQVQITGGSTSSMMQINGTYAL
jgi:YD repeat-containing protein